MRISTALAACCRPNMSILTHPSDDSEVVELSPECQRALLLLRLMHQLYEECDGGNARLNSHEKDTDTQKTGMRVEDLMELLCCCAANIQDEIDMEEAAVDMLTVCL